MELFLNKIVDKNKIMGIIKIREVFHLSEADHVKCGDLQL